ncbi:MAG: hypothetical protein IIB19_01535 [Chloroflexi bacterium]|nr:hypothetical protein [Chloroflexota bacterium]
MTMPPQQPQRVPPYVALVRIGAVIGMSVAAASGIFLLIAAQWLLAIGATVLAVPFFLVMRLVEGPAEEPEDPEEAPPTA